MTSYKVTEEATANRGSQKSCNADWPKTEYSPMECDKNVRTDDQQHEFVYLNKVSPLCPRKVFYLPSLWINVCLLIVIRSELKVAQEISK